MLALGLFAAGLVLVPFDAFRGVAFLGELGNEASFFLFAPAIALMALGALGRDLHSLLDSWVLRIGAAALAIIGLSFFANIDGIIGTVVRERSAIGKFATSLMVVGYGFSLAWLVEQLGAEKAHHAITRFVCLSVVIALAFLPIEWLGERGYLGGLYEAIDGIIHSRQSDIINAWDGSVNDKVLYDWDERLRSVSFEPPAFGNYTGLAWPWVWYAAVSAETSRRRMLGWTLLIVLTIAIIATDSRTGMLLLAVNLAAMALIATLYGRVGQSREAVVAARVLAPTAVGIAGLVGAAWLYVYYDQLVPGLVAGDSVSNLSRAALQISGFEMFADNPVFGTGFGQFGVNVAPYLPDWAFRSSEVGPMITFPEAPWPAAYSLYARLGAELGLLGLIGWVGLWLGLALKLAQARTDGGRSVLLHWPVIMNCFGVLASGIASDTFRTPMFWVAMGIGCALVKTTAVSPAYEPQPSPAPLRLPVPHRLP